MSPRQQPPVVVDLPSVLEELEASRLHDKQARKEVMDGSTHEQLPPHVPSLQTPLFAAAREALMVQGHLRLTTLLPVTLLASVEVLQMAIFSSPQAVRKGLMLVRGRIPCFSPSLPLSFPPVSVSWCAP